jgi:hypothetical protein
MMGCSKCYSEVVLVTVARRRKNRYGFYQILFSSMNNYGKIVVLGIGYLNIKCKAAY